MFAKLRNRAFGVFGESPPSLPRMRLGPENSLDNPLMLQFFTWESQHESMSWWRHLEAEIPVLGKMGFTQIWLPPPNKASVTDGRGYDAYDLVPVFLPILLDGIYALSVGLR